ncbi:MAG: single-stranded-DNA-specific exonuclease RecJ, partial [Lewinella sp.]|nr:single-stranded-DNA-specific exonuclease RecJ [Lewinella sp.]
MNALHQALGIAPILCRLLIQRGITTPAAAQTFFQPDWSQLHDPFLMQDMRRAVDRIELAIQRNERILIYGDYDVDGTMSVSFLYQFFLDLGHRELDYYFPDRYREGYGLSEEGVAYAAETGVRLLITVDCGIRAQEQVDHARSRGIDVIICDHHVPGDSWPFATAVLDPKRPDCDYPFKELSGCGVAFKLAQAIIQQRQLPQEDLKKLTEFVAISIASDLVPITGENRVLAYYGLSQINQSRRPGLRALMKVANRRAPLGISDIVYGLGPIINASGRMADAGTVVQLMLAADRRIATDYALALRKRNELRREFDRRTVDEARALMDAAPAKDGQALVLYQPVWHKGVIGIVAARLATDFHRPTVILTKSDDVLVGSARSVEGLDLLPALESCADILLSFGGHEHAAGLSMREADWESFAERFTEKLQKGVPAEGLQPSLEVAGTLDFANITPAFFKVLSQFAPFGPQNLNPLFVTQNVQDAGGSQTLKEGEHLRLALQQEGQ